MVERTFFGKPMRDISLMYHPGAISLEEFRDEVMEALPAFYDNLKDLRTKAGKGNNKELMEHWMETFLAWFELEQDPNEAESS